MCRFFKHDSPNAVHYDHNDKADNSLQERAMRRSDLSGQSISLFVLIN